MLFDLALVAAGLVLLVIGGDLLVRGAVSLALRLGIAPVIVGLTVVAFGTSAPEMIVSLDAAWRGLPGIALGNVVGSNIANVLIILGATALISPVFTRGSGLLASFYYMIAASALLIVLAMLGPMRAGHGLVLLAGLGIVLSLQIAQARRMEAPAATDLEGAPKRPQPGWMIGALLAGGLVLLPVGARLLVDGAVDIARLAGLSEAVIGLTLVAVGTSLPELAASVMSARRGESGMALGNIIGSNIFNILAIIGVTSFFGPLVIPEQMLRVDLWVMLGCALLIGPFLLGGWRMGRRTGAGLLALYAAYAGWLLI
ncbi:MAG: calcium/sodium antiporter [Paracoccus sp. (in: a-proteobacteria)]|nr:calcium/sodium antiporter [Paracoccus sp. (in: a-proteobacteria)]